MCRAATHASWLKTVTSAAARSTAARRLRSEAKASRPMTAIDTFGSNATSWKPGPTYRAAFVMASPPPHATSLSKYWER